MTATVIISSIIALIFISIIVKGIINKKRGKSGCSSCGACQRADMCHNNKK